MNKLQALGATALLSILGSIGQAHATMIDVTLGATSSDISFSSGANTLSPNANLTLQGPNLVFNNNSQIINAPDTVVGQYIQPTGTLFGDNYLAVRGVPSTGMATFTLGSALNTFGFTWGTLDSYNTLILLDSRNVTYTITGSDILNMIANSEAGVTQSDVTFTDTLASIVRAQFISTANAFEAANFSATNASAVPLPPAVLLFGMALMGLMLFAQMKNGKSGETRT